MPEIFRTPGGSFEAFYLRHYKAVYRLCYTFMKNPQDAEDCAEDVFLRAMTSGAAFENERHERAWLTTTAMNLCKDRLKHWWRRKVTPLDEQIDLPAPGAPGEDSGLLDAVMALPVKYKEVVWLHYYEGYQTDEIAAMLGRPASTVRNQLRDAREKLRQQLGGDDK